ncbi:MAG: hydroxylamine reductase [Bacteroidales bacterium]|nr:hydroxylamine reductase [Bacteroidales bacterium]
MFCYQCQEAAHNTGCTKVGVCGKTPEVSDLQDLLIYLLKGISKTTTLMREKKNKENEEANRFIIDSLFMTITNGNFDRESFVKKINEAQCLIKRLLDEAKSFDIDTANLSCECITWQGTTLNEMEEKAKSVGVLNEKNEDIRSLKQLLIYGIKGMAAYAEHAWNLDFKDDTIYAFIQKALVATTQDLSVKELVDLVLECGSYGVKTMALLDKANTTTYGNPEITMVNIGVRNNPAILISGHDLRDMQDLLEQTNGTGVDVYTHCEMLPANYYPAFKKYEHFVGNYGGSWWSQLPEFESFNGPILFTTNCIVPPRSVSSYRDRVYTTGAAGFEGFPHIADRVDGKPKDFSQIIAHAKLCDSPKQIETGTIVGGFAHAQVEALADKVVEAVESGAIKKFVVMAGCDGRMKSREYYTEFAKALPSDTVILTAGCAKYRYNKLHLGDINGIPRVLDAGQCNDSYSLAVIALKLKEIFGVESINDLPIVYNIAWYEQKAIIVFLALLALGVKNIHLGPTLPAFLSPNVINLLVTEFGVAPITTVKEDIELLI